MERPTLEVADIFRVHGPAWREAQRGHLSLAQLQGDVGHHPVPHGGAGRPCAALRRLPSRPGLLQLLPRPALPEVAEHGHPALARRPAGRPAAGGVRPRRLHAAGTHRRHRVHEQGRHVRAAVRRGGRGAADHRGRPEAPGRAHRRDLYPLSSRQRCEKTQGRPPAGLDLASSSVDGRPVAVNPRAGARRGLKPKAWSLLDNQVLARLQGFRNPGIEHKKPASLESYTDSCTNVESTPGSERLKKSEYKRTSPT